MNTECIVEHPLYVELFSFKEKEEHFDLWRTIAENQ